MNKRILLVDDEVNVLLGYKRTLRGKYQIECASSGHEALEKIQESEPYALIISDMNMPEMNGVELLSQVKVISVNTIRVMLTGNVDQDTAIQAVNKGDIFRFLNKPCSTENLISTINAGLEQYQLLTERQELLEGTLNGSINILSEVLSLVNPEAFGRISRVKKHVLEIAKRLDADDLWQLEALSSLCLIGCVVLSEEASRKIMHGEKLSMEEEQLFQMHPSVGSELIGKIPRMEEVAKSIQYQEKHFDGSGIPNDELKGKAIPLGARILKVVLDFERKEASGVNSKEAFNFIKQNDKLYDPDIVSVLADCLSESKEFIDMKVRLDELIDGMIVSDDIFTNQDILVTRRGHEINDAARKRLYNLYRNKAIEAEVSVRVTDAMKKSVENIRENRRRKQNAA